MKQISLMSNFANNLIFKVSKLSLSSISKLLNISPLLFFKNTSHACEFRSISGVRMMKAKTTWIASLLYRR